MCTTADVTENQKSYWIIEAQIRLFNLIFIVNNVIWEVYAEEFVKNLLITLNKGSIKMEKKSSKYINIILTSSISSFCWWKGNVNAEVPPIATQGWFQKLANLAVC